MERAEGYEASPGWARKDAPWSEKGGVLSVVGHVEVAGHQRLEMAHRAADSYARAELLRFLKTRIVAIIEESTKSSAGESVREEVEEQAEALTDDWLIAARYWEKRRVDGKERLDVYSRMDVDQDSVAALFEKAALAGDLRLTATKRLQEIWPDLAKEAIATAPDAHTERGIAPPEWARAGDQESSEDFTFVCQGSAGEEADALALAKARCDEKLCRLLGVRIQARTTVTETLEDMTAESQVSEQCDARIVGRTVTNKGGECGPSGCVYWLRQAYPRSEYQKELARLEAPQIIRQEVVIQEGDKHYKDPAACEAALRSYAAVSESRDQEKTLSAAAYQSRVRYLKQALGACQGIDGRDSGLFQSLNTLLLTPLSTFMSEAGNWSGEQTARAAFVYVEAGFRRELETKRFLTDRIQAIATVCQDAILPMRIFDLPLTPRDRAPSADELRASASVLDEVALIPFSEDPLKPSHRTTVHRIVLDPFFGAYPPLTPKYRMLLLSELGKGHLPCESNGALSAGAVIGYLQSDRELDDEEWSAGVRYVQKAHDVWLSHCISRLLPSRTAERTQRARAKQLSGLVLSGKIARMTNERGVQKLRTRDDELLEGILASLPPGDQLSLYLEIRDQLDAKAEESQDLATKVIEANFIGKSRGMHAAEADRALCESLPTRLPPVLASAPEFQIEDTVTCSCMGLDLPVASRAALRQLWLSETNESCRNFKPAEHPDGEFKWPYPERRWGDGPFVHIDHVLEKEAKQCDQSSSIIGLDFSPTLHATLTAGKLSRVSVVALPDATLFDLRWSKAPPGRKDTDWVRKADVESATKSYEACLRAAAEGYRVDPSDLQTKEAGPQRIWLQMGDQGSSNGFGE